MRYLIDNQINYPFVVHSLAINIQCTNEVWLVTSVTNERIMLICCQQTSGKSFFRGISWDDCPRKMSKHLTDSLLLGKIFWSCCDGCVSIRHFFFFWLLGLKGWWWWNGFCLCCFLNCAVNYNTVVKQIFQHC